MPSLPERVPLWPGPPPGRLHEVNREEYKDGMIFQTYAPTVSLVRPTAASTGWTTLICPGGGFNVLAWEKEGVEVARVLAGLGMTCVILAYRLRDWHVPVDGTFHARAISDATRAMRTIRAQAGAWGIDPLRIAIGGFSAGACLSVLSAVAADDGRPGDEDPIERHSSRAQALWLVYGDFISLTGDPAIPPTFLVHGADDSVVPAHRSGDFFNDLIRRKVPAELHIFQDGAHGFGVGAPGHPTAAWPGMLTTWLRHTPAGAP